MDVSIIIVNYNTKDILKNCLDSIYKMTKDIVFEVIVSDNGSSDGSVEMLKYHFPQTIVVENKLNIGFGAANNCGLKIARGKYVLYLNSDTILLNNAVKFFFDYWENSRDGSSIGVLGANLLDCEEKITHSYWTFPNTKREILLLIKRSFNVKLKKIFKRILHIKSVDYLEYIGDVEYVTGADMFLRNNCYAEFDERFFMYFDDVDICKRLHLNGYRSTIISGPRIIHLEGQSSENKGEKKYHSYNFTKLSAVFYYMSCCKYFRKYETGFDVFLLKIFITLTWLRPDIFVKNKKYFKTLWSI